MKSQDGEAKQIEKADETDRAPTGEQQEADRKGTTIEIQEEPAKEDASVSAAQPSDVNAAAVERSLEKTEDESAKDSAGVPEVEKGVQELDESRMHVLGHDDNIRTKSLEELPADQVG